ncbi:phosphopantothenoylcysteine decarboxylase / phosphopantothenate--cysteine ligase [Marininema mesophilum]|uniref:Phosphopantothenoylcysteine decarboxylase / phosphopantothenate--cysteine ligase n=1 Tax=Marininema mesophilum TaxID=1048340 RepID=A0A1H3AI48_9BACL|nr:flavoprotein [Marininema mesophilum]SDX29265.1 phosphopantothenoylcysteine decarboxylase / phosphopantothenate--cysteine ligase [Marininema mesophilum]
MDTDQLKIKNLLVGIGGSISVLAVPSYLTLFAHFFKEVKVIMTPSAARLLPRETVNLLCAGAYTDEQEFSQEISHVELTRWADGLVILPATANTMGQAANGLGDNLLTTAILAYPEPIIYFPNMNERMWRKKSLQRNIKTLEADGDIVVEPSHQMAYEVASGKMRPNYTIPSKENVMKVIYKQLVGNVQTVSKS